jgi:TatD DNase family protein
VIDTHCHLTFPDFLPPARAGGVESVLRRAREAGIDGCITISTTTHDAVEALGVARAHKGVWCSAGVHPLYSDKSPHDWERLRTVAQDDRCVAWGELGLDNHYSLPEKKLQRAVLEEQLDHITRWTREGLVKPIILHCREAFDDLIPLLRASGLDPARFVFHCFTGDERNMRALLDFGAMVSFTGVVTYPNAPEVRKAALLAPLDRVMIETDAPFLSPHPHRGTRPCEPWMASVTARALADLRGERWEDFERAVNTNTLSFFGVSVEKGAHR